MLQPALGPPAEEGRGAVGAGPEESSEDDERAGAPLPWTQAETAGVLQPAEGFRETLQHLPVLNEAYRKDTEGRFTKACNHRTRENGFKLKIGRFRLDIKKKFFT